MNKKSASLTFLLAVAMLIGIAGNSYCAIGEYVYSYPYAWDKKPEEVAVILELWGRLDLYQLQPLITKFDNYSYNDDSRGPEGRTGTLYWRKVQFLYGKEDIELIFAMDERSLHEKSIPPIHRIGVRKKKDRVIYEEMYQHDIKTGGWIHWIKAFPEDESVDMAGIQPKRIWSEIIWKINDKFWLTRDLLVPKGNLSSAKEFELTHFYGTLKAVQQKAAEQELNLNDAMSMVLKEMRGFEFVDDAIEHLQSLDETRKLKTGDCEDLTNAFLVLAREYGTSLENLGINLMRVKIRDNLYNIHAIPLVFDGHHWLYMQTFEPGSELKPIDEYNQEKLSEFAEQEVEIYNFYGLHEDGRIEVLKNDSKIKLDSTLSEWIDTKLQRAKEHKFIPLISEKEIRDEFDRRLEGYTPDERKRLLQEFSNKLKSPSKT
ncbi:MAG: hypothetical protein P8X90_04190 [Desulfobacterales bacterium]|jgi:hypothetical protein